MNFEKKMKQRLYVAVGYCVLGIILIAAAVINRFENMFLSSYGLALLVLGILRIVQNRRITKSAQSMHRREVAESDERTRFLSDRAKSWTFSYSIIACGIIVIVLSLLGYHEQAQPFSWFVCAMITLYWIFYLIASKKY